MLKNIIIVQDFAHINGGNANVAISSAIGLANKGYNVVFFTGMSPIDERLASSGVIVHCLEKPDLLSDKNVIRAFFKGLWDNDVLKEFSTILDKYSPADTIIHLHGWLKTLSPSIWDALAQRDFKVVVTLHDYFMFCHNGGLYNFKSNQICKLNPSSLRCYFCNCDSRSYFHKLWRDIRQVIHARVIKKNKNFGVITIGQLNEDVSRQSLAKYAKKWYRVQNPIDLNSQEFVRISENDCYFMVGRISEEKGFRMFCKVMTELKLKGCILGDGPIRRELEQKYPNIEFLGWHSGQKKSELIKRKAKCLVYPSLWYEGSPLTPIEFKSYGIPSIVSDMSAAAEQVTDGKDGYLFRIGDEDALKTAILKYEKTDLGKMQNYIKTSFKPDLYTSSYHCEKLEYCYNDMLNEK